MKKSRSMEGEILYFFFTSFKAKNIINKYGTNIFIVRRLCM